MNDMQQTEELRVFRFATPALAIGVLGLAASAAGAFIAQEQFYRSWLVAFVFWTALTIGSLAIAMIQFVTGGWWGYMIRRPLLAATTNIPLMFLAAIPIMLGASQLYPWMDHELMVHDPILSQKMPYLNYEFFLVRLVFFFTIWFVWSLVLRRLDAKYDEVPSPKTALSLRNWSAIGLLIYGLSATFASVDWMMSLDPYWFSTMFGLAFIVGSVLLAFAVAILVTTSMARQAPYVDVVEPIHFRDLGNLMFAFVLLWAYMAFSQFLLIWYGNIKEEIPWYLIRSHGGFGFISVLLIVGHFFLPFLLLLMRGIKERPKLLGRVAIFIIAMRAIDYYWIVAPNFTTEGHHATFSLHWLDFSTLLGIGGLWTFMYLRALGKRRVLPIQTHLEGEKEALNHG